MGEQINFEPINNDILVFMPVVEEETLSGIIKSPSQIEEEQKNRDEFFHVVAVSKNCKQIKVGDKVFISNGRHPQVALEDKLYMIVNEMSVLGKKID